MKPNLCQVDVDNVVIASLYTITFLKVLSLIVVTLRFTLSLPLSHLLVSPQIEFPLPANDSINIKYRMITISSFNNIVKYWIIWVVSRY